MKKLLLICALCMAVLLPVDSSAGSRNKKRQEFTQEQIDRLHARISSRNYWINVGRYSTARGGISFKLIDNMRFFLFVNNGFVDSHLPNPFPGMIRDRILDNPLAFMFKETVDDYTYTMDEHGTAHVSFNVRRVVPTVIRYEIRITPDGVATIDVFGNDQIKSVLYQFHGTVFQF